MAYNNEKNSSYLLDIFHSLKGKANQILPIVKDPYKIKDFIFFLKSSKINISTKYDEILKLFILFKSNLALIPFFIKECKMNNLNLLYELIFDIYLNEEINRKKEESLENLLKLLITHTSLPKSALEYLCQKMSLLFRKDNQLELNQELFMKYLNLFHLCYKDNSLHLENIENNGQNPAGLEEIIENKKNEEVKNYIYFTGINSSLTLKLNNNSTSVISDFPNLENGLSFTFWLNIEKNILVDYNNIHNSKDKNFQINLITLNLAEHRIKFILKESKYFQLSVDKNESNLIDINSIFTFGKWVNICFIITKKVVMNSATIKIFINGVKANSELMIPKEFPTKVKINKIILFENLIGRVSSLLFFSFPLSLQLIKCFSLKMNNGIYNNKILFKFLISNENNYFKNAINYKYYEKYKNEKNKDKLLNILLKEQNIKNIITIFPPFSYDRRGNYIDDIFGNYLALLSNNDGVNFYVNHIKNIQIIGGIINLLPISELMLKFKNTKNNIITESIVLKYLYILKDIIIGHNNNLYDANKNYFFSSLSLFLERFPSNIFTTKLLHVLLDIGKEVFQSNDINNENQSYNFINDILLNEKIFSKFSTENQVILWDGVHKFFISDYSKIKESLSIHKICILLRFYDENRYNEYCCQNHANLIKNTKNMKTEQNNKNKVIKNVMNPEMKVKTEKIFEIIELYINKFGEDTDNLFKLLLLDLSPCLQLKIIQVYINYFICNQISNENKEKALNNLLKSNMFEISEYVLSISLLDVRIEILKLIKILFQLYRNNIKLFYSESQEERLTSIFHYIGDNILPDKIFIEIEHDKKSKDDKDIFSYKKRASMNLSIIKRSSSPSNLNKKITKFRDSLYEKNIVHKDRIPLMKYINKEIYDEQKENLWRLISSWIIYEKPKKNKKSLRSLKINNFVVNFCISFTYKNDLKYISSFLIILNAYFNDDYIINNNEFFSNNKLFSWIIEIVFYFYNEENIKNLNNKDDQENVFNIQKKSLEALKLYIIKKDNNNEIEETIKFIFDYSVYLKNEADEENIEEIKKKNKKNEISRITSLLMLICLESSPKNINFITKVCFQVLIYYKNCKIVMNKNEIINDIKNNNNDFQDDDDSFEVVDKPLRKRSSIIIINDINNNEKESKINDNKDSLIPNYILEGINYDASLLENFEEGKNNQENNKIISQNDINFNSSNNYLKNQENHLKKNILLKEIWKDFALYDYIIDYYYSTIWGLENLCKLVEIEYENNPIELIKKLYKEYSNNKKYKNILLKPIMECFNIKNNDILTEGINLNLNILNNINNHLNLNFNINNKKEKNKKDFLFNKKINILTINLILLSIAIEITNDKVQKEYLENQYQQFLIFCILASINIRSNEKHYNTIQNELYNILGYGCLFLKTKNLSKYQQILNYLINPIFKEVNEVSDNKRFKKVFKLTKKRVYDNTAVYKIFSIKETPYELNKKLNLNNKSLKDSNSDSLRYNNVDDLSNLINSNDIDNNDNKGPINENNENKDSINDINEFEDLDDKSIEIKPELQVDKKKRIDAIYNPILDQIDNKISDYIKRKLNNTKVDEININKEKKFVLNEIKKLIPNYIENLKKYSNKSYYIEKIRRNRYKKSKIKLFSWRGFWSNKYLFFTHPEYLKLKIKNHYSKEMIKPLLTPVLDIDYYFPKFKSFNTGNIFIKNNYNYNICLDIDEILKDEDKENNNSVSNKNSFNSLKNIYGFNYLECLYKNQDEEIWEYYKLFHEQQINPDKIDFKIKEDFLIKSKTIKKNKKKKDKIKNHSFQCCLVKIMNHTKGYINTKNDYLEFFYDEVENKNNENNNNLLDNIYTNLEDDISYDKDMGCCYGSLFPYHKRDKEKCYFNILYGNIKYLFIRNYYYRDTAVEIFTFKNKSYFFNFKLKDDLLLFISDIISNNSNIKFRQITANVHDDKDKNKILGYEQLLPYMKNKTYPISNKTEEWQNYKISTLEYLMWLNIYSGRSFNDLNQYPVFPWIIKNYSTDIISKEDFRDLNTPIGMLEINEKSNNRKKVFITFYETLKNEFQSNYPDIDYQTFLNKGHEFLKSYKKKKLKMMKKEKNLLNNEEIDIPYNQIPYNYGTHYSNPTYVSHFLSRIFPFSFVSIEIHGNKFDDPERMFFSMNKTFESISTLKDDIREIIPEFYFFPEMFKNINNLNLAQNKFDSSGKEVVINDVDMPLWAKNNSINFVLEKRKYLEGDEIPINKWIDIIFGSYQRGENSEKINNIYMSYTYEKMTNIMEIIDYDQRSALLRLYETGVTPRLLFKNDSKARIEKSIFKQKMANNDLNFLEESLSLDRNNLIMKNYTLLNNVNKNNTDYINKNCTRIVKITIIDSENVKIFSNTNQYFNFKTKKEKKEKKEKQEKKEKKEEKKEKREEKKEKKEEKKEKKANEEKKKIGNIENTSSQYAANYQISSIETPIIIYNNNKIIIKGGFWDGRLELNSLHSDNKEESFSSMIFPRFGPIVFMKMSDDEKLLFCGTKDGVIIVYKVNGKMLYFEDAIYSHNDEITSISINDNLNMFASTSLDGYIMLHTLPSLQLVRAIHISSFKQKMKDVNKINENIKINDNEQIIMSSIIINRNNQNEFKEINKINNNNIIENNMFNEETFDEYKIDKCLYSDNVFLSSSPLPCVAFFIPHIKIFRSYTINGGFINEIKEVDDSSNIFSPIIYKNLNFHEFLLYGTNNGYIKLRSFPKMDLIHNLKIDNYEIKTLTISNDKKYCYAWCKEDKLSVISDNIISDFLEI